MRCMAEKNIPYYEKNALDYARVNDPVSMQPFYDLFLKDIPDGGRILDAGCGTGRDSTAFLSLGYSVDAFDAAKAMVKIAREKTGLIVRCAVFQDFNEEKMYDGIWANASLLHVPENELADIFTRFARGLKTNGLLFASFKKGKGVLETSGRSFSLLDEEGLDKILKQAPNFKLKLTQTNPDQRDPNLPLWFSFILQKTNEG